MIDIDRDEGQAIEAPEMNIDEISPDEDERQAMQSLRPPKRSTSNRVIPSGAS
jgi:hypothetical protein